MKKIIFILVLLIMLASCVLSWQAKKVAQDIKFTVSLLDSNQIIFSEEDISSYEASTKTFTFTPDGAKKMKSYQPVMQLDHDGLYQKSFVAKLGDEEIYRGKFWTGLSSQGESGIVMTDIVMVGPDFNTLNVSGGYPISEFGKSQSEKINNPRLIEHFKKINKLKY